MERIGQLIDFWTYTCVNWRRTLPYIREWASKYKDHGLVVIGVHTPEFSFEQKLENITWSIKEMNIGYPVAVDNNYAIWQSFQKRKSAKYFTWNGRRRQWKWESNGAAHVPIDSPARPHYGTGISNLIFGLCG